MEVQDLAGGVHGSHLISRTRTQVGAMRALEDNMVTVALALTTDHIVAMTFAVEDVEGAVDSGDAAEYLATFMPRENAIRETNVDSAMKIRHPGFPLTVQQGGCK